MKRKEAILAISLATAMTATGCASQADVDALNNQLNEMSAQVTELQSELNNTQSEVNTELQKNTELENQVAELQTQLENAESELEDVEVQIQSADDDFSEMTINVTKYSQKDTAVYSKANESEEYKIADLEMNTECYIVATFSDANESGNWSAIPCLVTTEDDGTKNYQIISIVEKGDTKTKNKNVDFMLRSASSITVDGKEIKMADLEENQEVKIVYARSSLLSNTKVTEKQKPSTEKNGNTGGTQQQASDSWAGCDLPEVTPNESPCAINFDWH